MNLYAACHPACQRTLRHVPPMECWTSSFLLPLPESFVKLGAALGPEGDDVTVTRVTDPFVVQSIAHTIPVSRLFALDHNLLEPGTPEYLEAVAERDAFEAKQAAWRRSWPGRRARLRSAVRARWHDVRHAVARRIDPGCVEDYYG